MPRTSSPASGSSPRPWSRACRARSSCLSGEGALLRWNARMQAAIGYTSVELASMRPLDLIAPEDRSVAEAAIREVLGAGRESSIEVRLRDKTGESRPYAFGVKPLRVAGRDVRDRVRAGHLRAQARRGADDPRQGAPRPRAERLQPRPVGLGPAHEPRLLQRGVGRARGPAAAREHGRVGRGPRLDAPGGREPPRGRRGQRRAGRERGVRVRVSRPPRVGRLDLGLLAREGGAAGRGRPRAAHDGDLDQRHQAQGGGGAGRVPGHAGRADGAAQPRPAARSPRAGDRERRPPQDRVRVHVHRPRPVQDDQRLAGPRRRRRAAQGRGRRGCRRACAPPTPSRGWAATSSRSSSRTCATPTTRRRSRWPTR